MNRKSLPEAGIPTSVNQHAAPSITRPTSIVVKNTTFAELPRTAMDSWYRWCQQPEFYSAYFHPEFTACVDRVREDVRILLGYSQDQLVAIFPYQQCGRNAIEPVGGAVNDYHGVLCDTQAPVAPTDLLRGTEIRQLKFHSWIRPDEDIASHVYSQEEANIADFSNGTRCFLEQIQNKSSTIKRHPQKTRKLAREIGPIRLELDCRNSETLQWTIQKKRERYARTGVIDYFGVDWTRNLTKEIFETRTDEFGGMLSALYAGDQLVAAHFGMRCGSTLHYWYPVYDREYKSYSPGTQMFLEIVKGCHELGIDAIDFGYGQDPYKDKLTNRKFNVLRGCIDFNSLRSKYNKRMDRLVCRIKSSPAKQPLKRIVRLFLPGAGQPRV